MDLFRQEGGALEDTNLNGTGSVKQGTTGEPASLTNGKNAGSKGSSGDSDAWKKEKLELEQEISRLQQDISGMGSKFRSKLIYYMQQISELQENSPQVRLRRGNCEWFYAFYGVFESALNS